MHDWRRLPPAHALADIGDPNWWTAAGLEAPKSDVHQCALCGSVTISEVGGPPDESLFRLEPCETVMVRKVLDS